MNRPKTLIHKFQWDELYPLNGFSNNVTCGEARRNPDRPFFPGSEIDPHEFPWLVVVQPRYNDNNDRSCSGTLLDRGVVVTAANCFFKNNTVNNIREKAQNVMIILGVHDRRKIYEGTFVDLLVNSSVVIHPGYDGTDNDIALIFLTELLDWKINFHIRPVCIPPYYTRPDEYGGNTAVSIGWMCAANDCANSYINGHYWTPQKVGLKVVTHASCAESYKNEFYLGSKIICAGKEGRNSCHGENGSPLIIRNKLRGHFMTEYGEATANLDIKSRQYQIIGVIKDQDRRRCNKSIHPGLYTSFLDYLPWISEQNSQHNYTKKNI